MTAAKVKIKIEVTEVDSDTGEITRFRFMEQTPRRYLDRMPRLDFRKLKGDAEVSLTVSDDQQLDLKFSNDPLWIVEGTECPEFAPPETSTPTTEDGRKIFTAVRNSKNEKILTISNINNTIMEYTYRLNFTDGAIGDKVYWLDPKILNGGSPPLVKREERTLPLIVVGVIGVAIGAFLTLAAIRFELFKEVHACTR